MRRVGRLAGGRTKNLLNAKTAWVLVSLEAGRPRRGCSARA